MASMFASPIMNHYGFGERTVSELEGLVTDPRSLLSESGARARTTTYPLELEILSATRYSGAPAPSEASSNPRKRRIGQQMYGGLIFEEESRQAPEIYSSGSGDKKRTASSRDFYGHGGQAAESPRNGPYSSSSPPAEKLRMRKRVSKKARRSTKSSEDEIEDSSKKSRGRPRLDTQDATAADRRRTQIRLAQRAYRHRKETTISALNVRVSEIGTTIEQMNTSFLQLHDSIIDAGVFVSKPLLAQQLATTKEQFAALVKTALSQDSDQEEKATNIAKPNHPASNDGSDQPMPNVEAGTDDQVAPGGKTEQVWGYNIAMDDGSGPVEEISHSSVQKETHEVGDIGARSGQLFVARASTERPPASMSPDPDSSLVPKVSNRWSTHDEYPQFKVQLPDSQIDLERLMSEIERPLNTTDPYTYSFQETTFARRLHRMCLESAYRHLSNPTGSAGYIKRAFRFTFCFSNRKTMMMRFQELLRRKAGESLENWAVPFFRIGGAGTHFPRRDDQGQPVYPPNMVSPKRLFGPQKWILPETPRSGESVKQMLEGLGFGGEWFDSHDVEEYLKTKGIYLDGHSSFMDIDPGVINLPLLMHSVSASSVHSSRSQTKSPEPVRIQIDPAYTSQNINDDFNGFNLMASLQDKTRASENGPVYSDTALWNTSEPFVAPSVTPAYTPSYYNPVWEKRQSVTVDVNRFLQRMVEDGSTCLGRAPGFRKEMVDSALRLSLLEAI